MTEEEFKLYMNGRNSFMNGEPFDNLAPVSWRQGYNSAAFGLSTEFITEKLYNLKVK